MVISDIGSTDSTTLLCHTNRPPPAGSNHSEGDWYAPGGDRVNLDDGSRIYKRQRTYGSETEDDHS